jgi:hypothetical protein
MSNKKERKQKKRSSSQKLKKKKQRSKRKEKNHYIHEHRNDETSSSSSSTSSSSSSDSSYSLVEQQEEWSDIEEEAITDDKGFKDGEEDDLEGEYKAFDLSLDTQITLADCYSQWTVERFAPTGRRSDIMMLLYSLKYDHAQAQQRFKGIKLSELLQIDMLEMWWYPKISYIKMNLVQLLGTLDGLEWVVLCTMNPVMRTPEWINTVRIAIEALRARFYYFISHAPLSSRILNSNEDYCCRYRKNVTVEETDVDGLMQRLDLTEEDLHTDPTIIAEIRKKRRMQVGKLNWTDMGVPKNLQDGHLKKRTKGAGKGAEEEEEDDEDEIKFVNDQLVEKQKNGTEAASNVIEEERMTTFEMIYDLGWIFYTLDRHFAIVLSKKERIPIPYQDISRIRMHLVAICEDSWINTLAKRKLYQYNYQCLPSHYAKYERRQLRSDMKAKEVLGAKLQKFIDCTEPLPNKAREMLVRPPSPVEVVNMMNKTEVLDEKYWKQRVLELDEGWKDVNTDFMFQMVGGMETEEGDAVDYVIRHGRIERIRITGKWLLRYGEKEYLAPSLTAAYKYMRVLMKKAKDEPNVYNFQGAECLEMPAVVNLAQFDKFFFK